MSPIAKGVFAAGLAGLGWVFWYSATGDERCAERCRDEGYTEFKYSAPVGGTNKESCSCKDSDGNFVRMR